MWNFGHQGDTKCTYAVVGLPSNLDCIFSSDTDHLDTNFAMNGF